MTTTAACPECPACADRRGKQKPQHWPLFWFGKLCATHDQVARASSIWPPKGWGPPGSKRDLRH